MPDGFDKLLRMLLAEKSDLQAQLKFLLSPDGRALRENLLDEAVEAFDLLNRQSLRRHTVDNLPKMPSLPLPLPILVIPSDDAKGGVVSLPSSLPTPLLPVLIPTDNGFVPTLVDPKKFLDIVAPPLTTEEEVRAKEIFDIVTGALDMEDRLDLLAVQLVRSFILSTGRNSTSLARLQDDLSSSPVSDGSNPLQEIISTMQGLEEAERSELLNVASRISERLRLRLEDRLKPLAT